MNKTKTIVTDDPFRAAYLMLFGRYKETKVEKGQHCYVIEGDVQTLTEQDYRFRTGYALVNPLVLREAVFYLKELSGEEEIELEEMAEPLNMQEDA